MDEVVIIGHGPSPVGKKYGKIIDGVGTVIRMHSCEWQQPEDYGSKYDYGVLPGPWLTKALEEIKEVPQYGWLLYFLSNQNRVKKAPGYIHGKFVLANEANIFELLGDMQTPPTRGLCAIALAIIYLKPKKIWLVGFDSVLSGIINQYPDSYEHKMPQEYIGTHTTNRHNYLEEKDRVNILAEKFGIPIKPIEEYV